MKKILAPTDFSETANSALRYAFGLAAFTGMGITILHVFHFLIPTNIPSFEYKEAIKIGELQKEKEIKLQLNKFINSIPGSDKVNFSIHAKYGFAAEKIALVAELEMADIIIMGTKGNTGIKKLLMGSVASEVIQKANCPVMIISKGIIFQPPKKIVFATDFKEINNYSALKGLRDLAIMFNAKVTVLHVHNKGEKELAPVGEKEEWNIENFLPGICPTYQFIEDGKLAPAIENFARSTKADILAVMPQEHNFFINHFGNSVSKELIPIAEQPLLAIKNK